MFFDVVELTVAAMTGYHQRLGAGYLNLIHLFPAVKDALLIITGGEGTSTAAAADLVHSGRMELLPALDALGKNPARFFEESVPEPHLRLSPIIARVMIGGRLGESVLIQFDATALDIVYEQIKNSHKVKFFKSFRVVRFKPGPG